jgi:hypothetical protein
MISPTLKMEIYLLRIKTIWVDFVREFGKRFYQLLCSAATHITNIYDFMFLGILYFDIDGSFH